MARVVLGITGSVAAYRGAELARLLVQGGHQVRGVLTGGGQRFITPLQLQALTGNPVAASQWTPLNADGMDHIAWARWADAVVVAPATAAFLARAAAGLADDLLGGIVLATTAPVMVAPAMNTRMLEHPATRHNLGKLRAHGVHVIESESGDLACGEQGVGRMAEPAAIVRQLQERLSKQLDASGVRALVTAGPTEEPIDPVRVVTNRSSGRMGFALAEALTARGARVTLICGPTPLEPPAGVAEVIRIRTTEQLREQVIERLNDHDLLIMAAAPADWRPQSPEATKRPRQQGALTLTLEATPDILAEAAVLRRHQVLVGFALESGDLAARGRTKLERKGIDLIAVNDPAEPGSGPQSDTNRLVVVHRDGRVEELPLQNKRSIADRLVDTILPYLDD